jgi:hypothetical protein
MAKREAEMAASLRSDADKRPLRHSNAGIDSAKDTKKKAKGDQNSAGGSRRRPKRAKLDFTEES